MRRLEVLDQSNFRKYMPFAVRLVAYHRDGHITRSGFNKLRSLRPKDIAKGRAVVVVAIENGRLVGVLACADQGRSFAIVVVHRSYRKMGLAKKMLEKAVEASGGFYCEVAGDNFASIKTCCANGLVAYDAYERNGKIVLKFKALGSEVRIAPQDDEEEDKA